MKRIKLGIGIFALANLAFLNFARSERNLDVQIDITTSTLVTTSVTSTSSSSTASGGTIMKWSAPIPCDKKLGGSYCTCLLSNGTGNVCDSAGTSTCTCGRNCQ